MNRLVDSDDVGVSASATADLVDLIESTLSKDFDIQQQVKQVCDEKSLESERQKKKAAKKRKVAKPVNKRETPDVP